MLSASVSSRAYDELRRRILILEIRPGERLKEEEWAAKLNVGRLAVREALTRLHGEALVTHGAKGGFFAASLDEHDVHEIREIREVLEVAALRLAQKRITANELQELESTCDDFGYMVKKGYHVGACEADRRFHQLLVSASGNSRLIRAYEHSHIPLFQVRLGRTPEYFEDYDKTDREHREIVRALKSGDINGAIALLCGHFSRGAGEVLAPAAEAPRSGDVAGTLSPPS